MAIKFQFNKTAMQQLKRELKVRVNALPTLQAKEAALRLEVKRAKEEVKEVEESFQKIQKELSPNIALWPEFPNILSIKNLNISFRKIAGVSTPVFQSVEFALGTFSLFSAPSWVPQGLVLLQRATEIEIRKKVSLEKLSILEYARKKTTQKVNLYEKVQIPEYKDAILQIKRFLEDAENLAKSSQKILKERMTRAEEDAA